MVDFLSLLAADLQGISELILNLLQSLAQPFNFALQRVGLFVSARLLHRLHLSHALFEGLDLSYAVRQLFRQVGLGAFGLVLGHLQYLVRLQLLLTQRPLGTLHVLHRLLELANAVLLLLVDALKLTLSGLKVRQLMDELLMRLHLIIQLSLVVMLRVFQL